MASEVPRNAEGPIPHGSGPSLQMSAGGSCRPQVPRLSQEEYRGRGSTDKKHALRRQARRTEGDGPSVQGRSPSSGLICGCSWVQASVVTLAEQRTHMWSFVGSRVGRDGDEQWTHMCSFVGARVSRDGKLSVLKKTASQYKDARSRSLISHEGDGRTVENGPRGAGYTLLQAPEHSFFRPFVECRTC